MVAAIVRKVVDPCLNVCDVTTDTHLSVVGVCFDSCPGFQAFTIAARQQLLCLYRLRSNQQQCQWFWRGKRQLTARDTADAAASKQSVEQAWPPRLGFGFTRSRPAEHTITTRGKHHSQHPQHTQHSMLSICTVAASFQIQGSPMFQIDTTAQHVPEGLPDRAPALHLNAKGNRYSCPA